MVCAALASPRHSQQEATKKAKAEARKRQVEVEEAKAVEQTQTGRSSRE